MRSPHNFNPSDVVCRKMREIVNATRLIHRNAVDKNLRVIGFTASREERRDTTGVSRADNVDAAGISKQVGRDFDV